MQHSVGLLWGMLCLFSSLWTEAFLISPLDLIRNQSETLSLLRLALAPNSNSGNIMKKKMGGGRAPGSVDNLVGQEQQQAGASGGSAGGGGGGATSWIPTPCQPEEARLTVVQITDTYTLEHLASVKTLLQDIRSKAKGSTVISAMTGDFLAPYLLSSVDRGQGMMNALAKVPIDYLTWGNHEADINHKTVCRHVREFPGTWLNSNMLDHEAMDHQKEFDVVKVTSPDGSNTRKIGLVAVLSDDSKLYEQFNAPGAFGGATIDCPWKTLERLKVQLEGPDYACDTIIPMQHTYVPDDHKTCRMFDFPVLLSGHDHHRVDEVIDGTRLLKPGMDSVYATVLELIWPNAQAVGKEPVIKATFVKTADWEPDAALAEECERAYDALAPLRNTELARVPPSFEPLSSVNSRGTVTSMGEYLCTLLRSSLNVSRRQRSNFIIDAVFLMGGNIRGGTDYPKGSYFSLEALEAEIKSDEVIAVVPMPGWLLAEGIQATHAGDPIPGWMQYDNGVFEDFSQDPPVVTQVRGRPIIPDQIYRVATKISDLTNGQSPPWTKYYQEHPELLPPKGAYANIQAELMSYFARNLWRRIWDNLSQKIDAECDVENADDDCQPETRLETLDIDRDGKISVADIQDALDELVGLSVDNRELTLAKFVHDFADTNGNGEVTLEDMRAFCDEMSEVHERDQWRLAFKKEIVDPKVASS
jgi:2',3'-cyclic-nucleotide 2'-phosphodiesterase (5'-nucleotidase family)